MDGGGEIRRGVRLLKKKIRRLVGNGRQKMEEQGEPVKACTLLWCYFALASRALRGWF